MSTTDEKYDEMMDYVPMYGPQRAGGPLNPEGKNYRQMIEDNLSMDMDKNQQIITLKAALTDLVQAYETALRSCRNMGHVKVGSNTLEGMFFMLFPDTTVDNAKRVLETIKKQQAPKIPGVPNGMPLYAKG